MTVIIALAQLIDKRSARPAAGVPVILSANIFSAPAAFKASSSRLEFWSSVLWLAGISDDHAALCQKPPKTTRFCHGVWSPKTLIRGEGGGRDRNDRLGLRCSSVR